jgi:hypothetical protein
MGLPMALIASVCGHTMAAGITVAGVTIAALDFIT